VVSKDRVLAAIQHQKVDRPPWGEIVLDDTVVSSFLGCEHISFPERWEFVQALGLDLVCQAPIFPVRQKDALLPEAHHANWGDLDSWVRLTDRFVFVMLDGVFGWGIRVFGFRRFMVELFRVSSDLERLIRDVEGLNLKLARRARDRGAEGVLLADDLAYQRGLMVSPDVFRHTLLPSLVRQTEAVKALGMSVFFHSDGNINAILVDLAEIGFDGWQGLEAAAGMDLGLIKRDYGARVCLWGNMDPAHLQVPSSPDEIASRLDAIWQATGQGNGFILGTSSGLIRGIRPENLRAIRDRLALISKPSSP
jgi:uroporphyrinogen decarboxylase